ncbi:hypothetical protein EPO15_01940 [bacterium]|nr:MAG: hypothetical protein EPO15_01940 [bacterium]
MTDAAELEFDGALFHPDAVLAAAHALARRLRVSLKPDGRGGTLARVSPPEGADALLDEAAAQELRRRIAVETRPLREYIVTQSLLSAGGERTGAPAASSPALSPEEEAEVDRLIAEAEKEIAEKVSRFEAAGEPEPTWEERARAADGPAENPAP